MSIQRSQPETMTSIESEAIGYEYAKACATRNPETVRSPGMSLTAIQHAQNLFYEAHANQLPNSPDAVRQMGWNRTEKGVNPEDLATLFVEIRVHASGYQRLTTALDQATRHFNKFAKDFAYWGKYFVLYGDAIAKRQRQNDELTEQDLRDRSAMSDFLTESLNDTKTAVTHANSILNLLTEFMRVGGSLQNNVQSKLLILQGIDLGSEINRLESELERLRQQLANAIEAKNRALRNMWTKGAAGLIIGMVISATIYGIEAARHRRNINQISADKYQLQRQLEEKERALAALESMEGLLTDINHNLGESITSIEHLQDCWLDVTLNTTRAQEQLIAANNATAISIQTRRMSNAVSYWQLADQIASDISGVIAEGRDIFRRLWEQGVGRVPIDHPDHEPRFLAIIAGKNFLN
jgi:hypothetical protein